MHPPSKAPGGSGGGPEGQNSPGKDLGPLPHSFDSLKLAVLVLVAQQTPTMSTRVSDYPFPKITGAACIIWEPILFLIILLLSGSAGYLMVSFHFKELLYSNFVLFLHT